MTVPSGWTIYDFPKTIVKNKVGRNNQINASEIKSSGKYPVIDQGQDYIAGYSDEKDTVYKPEQPLVIFGDHTRCFKYVDFPFIIGADGTKVLTPNTSLCNPKFFYFYLLSLDIPSRGYNRHFKLLKEKKILCPAIPEQQNIAHILSQIQFAIETQERIIKTTTELKKALMQKLFTEGLKGEPQKETEIGLVSKSWEVKRIDEVYDFTNKPRGLDLTTLKQVPFIPMDLIPDDNLLVKDFELRKIDELSSGTYIENGDLLIAKITPSFENGKQAIVDFGHPLGFATTEVIPIKEKDMVSCKQYLFYYLLKHNVRSILAGKMEGATGRQRLSKAILGETLIPFPSHKEQVEIADTFIKMDNKVHFAKSKKTILTALFKSMLHHLMTGQIRVSDLKLA